MDRGARRGDVGFVSRRDRDYVDHSQLVGLRWRSIIIRDYLSHAKRLDGMTGSGT